MFANFTDLKEKYGFNNLFIIAQDVSHARGAAKVMKAVAEKKGWNVTGVEIYPTGATDFSMGLLKAKKTDTEIIMHAISHELSANDRPALIDVMQSISRQFDGAYSTVLLNAHGDMLVARDPLGIKPLCYARQGPLVAAASVNSQPRP